MRSRSALNSRFLAAKIIAFVLAGECIAYPIWGLIRAMRAPTQNQTLHAQVLLRQAWADAKPSGPLGTSIPADGLAAVVKNAGDKAAAATPMDPLSQQLFGSRDVKFTYVFGQKAQSQAFEVFLFGKLLSKLDYTEIVAAPSGSTIRVKTDILSQCLVILVNHPLYKGTQVRVLFKYSGKVMMLNAGWIVRDDSPSGVATRIVGRQVYMAHRIGVWEIGVYAAGSYGDPSFNGYYTWPRLGFNVPLADYKEPLEADGFHDVADTNDLFARPGGPDWWKRHGSDCYGVFDVDPQSTSSLVLKKYLKAKGAVPYEGAD